MIANESTAYITKPKNWISSSVSVRKFVQISLKLNPGILILNVFACEMKFQFSNNRNYDT